MRFVRFDDDRLGLLSGDGEGVIDLTERLGLNTNDPLQEYLRTERRADYYEDAEPDHSVKDIRLESPVRRPGKIIAAPLNYERHIEEAVSDKEIDLNDWFSIEHFGFFLKAPSSVVGPKDQVVLPFSDRRVDHEVELAFVVGKDAKDVPADDAWNHIFGYTVLLDVTVRGEQDRSNRKSYDTFTVIGPCVVTPEEIDDPQNLALALDVNGDVRQDANTDDMVYTCADVMQYASIGTTLEVGDVVTTGTPEGVGPLEDGDVIHAEIEDVGSMSVDVVGRDVAFTDVNVTKSGQE